METTQQETPASAPETAQKPKKVIGRPFTKENAKQYQLSATQAKKRRKEARMKMLSALTDRLDMGEELYKALSSKDPIYLEMIEKATRLVGLRWEDSDEGREQRFNLKADTKSDVKTSGKLEIEVKGL
jgi:hypothetical protein